MARVTIEDCLKKVDSRFHLMHLTVQRVLQLRNGMPPMVDAPKNKDVVVALREIAAGKVTPQNILQIGETRRIDSPSAKEDIMRADVRDIMEEASQFEGPSDHIVVQETIDEDED